MLITLNPPTSCVSGGLPRTGTFKLNIDDSFSKDCNKGGIGGVIRYHNCNWVMGFYHNITAQSHTMAEIEALLDNLKIATDCSIVPIEIELDSIEVIEALEDTQSIYASKINSYRLLMKRLGNPLVRHSFRQANKVADFLSRLDTKLTPSAQATILSTPPDHTMSLIKDDQQGVISIKLVLRTTCNKLACFGNLTVIVNYGDNVEANRPHNRVTP
ncbi:hypothetical protein KY290_010438 [Solanum tuberosum]|uniref:RNase H type-1 domain-containing protein n=1 Tax=Solanum tuberosum TaxID=4113 RepID=A0ABQ7VXR7_SOLTU|nr:hypothetical protein KY289_012395 [Solanum tuberosum]KAH0709339.1 hypothetical protein KY284_010766 [Solanum tuberosum]KAH0735352.1 hypothetical protein KY285_011059 [Solanum tuberosum]KAH0773301.1 hypothetical protein KY290_010438 [Solanum tuberosum]